MTWFGGPGGRSLLSVLAEDMSSALSGVVDVVGREVRGQVFFTDHQIVYASCDGFLPLVNTLELSGAADAAALNDLAASSRLPWRLRDVPPAVTAVVRDLSEVALDHLLGEAEGSTRVSAGEWPPLGVLMSVPLEELATGASVLAVRARASQAVQSGLWRSVASGAVSLSAQEVEVMVAMSFPASAVELSRRCGLTVDSLRGLLQRMSERGLVQRIGQEPGSAGGGGYVGRRVARTLTPPAPAPVQIPATPEPSAAGFAKPSEELVTVSSFSPAPPRPEPRTAATPQAAHAAEIASALRDAFVPVVRQPKVAAADVRPALPKVARPAGRTSALRRLIGAVRAG